MQSIDSPMSSLNGTLSPPIQFDNLYEKFEIFSPKASHLKHPAPCYDDFGNFKSFANVDYDSWFNSKYCLIKSPAEAISYQRA